MRTTILAAAVASALAFTPWLQAATPAQLQHSGGQHQHSPYAGEQNREIKALTDDEIEALLAGDGMGFAKPAELNGYPGPRHVLDLAEELALGDERRVAVEGIFDAMRERAIFLGEQVVNAERQLEHSFRDRTIDAITLEALLDRIQLLEARLRGVHLRAHLETRELLTDEQVRLYDELRGYEVRSEVR